MRAKRQPISAFLIQQLKPNLDYAVEGDDGGKFTFRMHSSTVWVTQFSCPLKWHTDTNSQSAREIKNDR